jgi:hypothetical protein
MKRREIAVEAKRACSGVTETTWMILSDIGGPRMAPEQNVARAPFRLSQIPGVIGTQ